MKSRRLLYLSLVAIPVVALLTLGQHFLTVDAPRMVSAEKGFITMQYRRTAEVLVDDPSKANWRGDRDKGWRQVSRIARKYPWGVVHRGDDKVLIWVQLEDKSVVGKDGVPELDFNPWLFIYGPFCLVMFIVVMMFFAGLILIIHYDRERESFLASMVHDLRNPLVAIKGLAKSDPEYVERIAENLLAMVQNAQDFLGLGRRRKPEIKNFDVIPLIRDSYRVFEEYFTEDESGAVEFNVPEKLEVCSDETTVRQILWNLFSNAAKYAAPYGPVKVRAEIRDGKALIVFEDQGKGMSRWQMYRAFGRYYRVAGLHECGKGGFGIGLYTSRAAARRLGGDLTVRANKPKGCVFTLSLKI